MLAFFAFAGGALAQTLTPLHLYMGKPTILDPGLSRYKVRGMDVVDFDGDRLLDVGLLLEDGYAVMWGKGGGAFAPSQRVWKATGRHAVAAVYGGERLYLSESGSEVLLEASLKGRAFSILRSSQRSGGEWIGACAAGAVHGPDAGGHLYIEREGARKVWARGVPEACEIELVDADGDGDSDALIRDVSGDRCGVLVSGKGARAEVTWLPESGGFSWMNVYRTERTSYVVCTGPSRDAAAYPLSGPGAMQSGPVPFAADGMRYDRVSILPWNGGMGLFVGHHQVTHAAHGGLIGGGVLGPMRSLFERPRPRDILARDMDGDGDLDLVVLDLDGSAFHTALRLEQRAANLARFVRFIMRREARDGLSLTRTDWQRLLAGYEPDAHARATLRPLVRANMRRTQWWHRLGWALEALRGEKRR